MKYGTYIELVTDSDEPAKAQVNMAVELSAKTIQDDTKRAKIMSIVAQAIEDIQTVNQQRFNFGKVFVFPEQSQAEFMSDPENFADDDGAWWTPIHEGNISREWFK